MVELKRMLIVDDTEVVLNGMKKVFEEHYHVSISNNPNTALEMIAQNYYHILVSDYSMPEMNGIELITEAKKIKPKLLCILHTLYADTYRDQAIAAGASDVIMKCDPKLRERVDILAATVPKRILVVDDDPAVCRVYEMLLKSKYDVESCNNPLAAPELIKNYNPDLVISDFNMPGMNGIQLLIEVRKNHPNLPFMIGSAGWKGSSAEEAMKAGATDTFDKFSVQGNLDKLIKNYISQSTT